MCIGTGMGAAGVFVGEQFQRPGVPMVCLETALPVKFGDTVLEALGRLPGRPPRFEALEDLERFCDVLPNDAEAIKAYIAQRLAAKDAAPQTESLANG